MAKLPLTQCNTIFIHTTNCNPHIQTKCWLFILFCTYAPITCWTPMMYVQNGLELKVTSRSYQPYFNGDSICIHHPKFHFGAFNIKKNIPILLGRYAPLAFRYRPNHYIATLSWPDGQYYHFPLRLCKEIIKMSNLYLEKTNWFLNDLIASIVMLHMI